jgi:hypothetical protein
MDQTDHHLLVGAGAQAFARSLGFAIEDDLNTEHSRKAWLEWKRRSDPKHYLDPDRRAAIVPLSLEHLWKHAHRLAAESVDNGVLDADSLSSPLGAAEDLAEARRSYEEWTRSLPLADLDTLLYGTGNEPRLASALREALAAIAPHRGIEPPRTRLSVRLPLGSSGGAAVCFWLAFFRRALAWHSVLPTFFWTHSGEAGQLLLSLGRPAASVLDQLWLPGSVSDDLCDLAGEPSAESWTTAPPEIESILGDPSSTISDLLVAIGASE